MGFPSYKEVAALPLAERAQALREPARKARILAEKSERLAGDGIELAGWRTDEEIRNLYRTCTAAILPGEEDFGIVPVEAQACGRPVVALGRGGALDTVIDGETGVLFGDATVDSLAAGLQRAATTPWSSARIRAHAETFSRRRFVAEIEHVVDDTLRAPAGTRW